KIVLAYRHSDTGVLTGTSETLFSVKKTPWEDMPGFAILESDKNSVTIRMWDQEMTLKKNRTYRIHFGKTIVYLKNYGPIDQMEWTEEVLSDGPAQLHSADVDENITIAPPTGSGIQVKMGQETQN
ncbi:MAG: hypothetical protein IT286_05760, partial [Proteobacteria bacterium]|nr:hypothetical protein [Pseudomonadota bacterium]